MIMSFLVKDNARKLKTKNTNYKILLKLFIFNLDF